MSTLPGDSTLAGTAASPHRGECDRRPGCATAAAGAAGRRPRGPPSIATAAHSAKRCCMRRKRCARWSAPTRSGWSSLAAFVGCGAGIAGLADDRGDPARPPDPVRHRPERAPQRDGRARTPCAPCWCPAFGGLALGLVGLASPVCRPRRAVDPIEANALYGGRMSLNDSLIVVLQTIMSNGVGASIGLEAGYTQIGSAVASRLGRMFRVRRNDLRVLVGCGAAGAIAGAFNAPLTGAFYAFELVIGTYTLGTFAPVAVVGHRRGVRRACAGRRRSSTWTSRCPAAMSTRWTTSRSWRWAWSAPWSASPIMRGVTLTEELFRTQRRAGLAAPGDRRAGGRDAGAGHAGGAVVRPRRAGHRHRGALSADPCRPAGGAEVGRVGDLDRLRLPRRPVLRLAVPGRAGGQDLRRRAGARQHRARRLRRMVCALVGHERRWRSPSSAAR